MLEQIANLRFGAFTYLRSYVLANYVLMPFCLRTYVGSRLQLCEKLHILTANRPQNNLETGLQTILLYFFASHLQ